jgi:hypothetical protein
MAVTGTPADPTVITTDQVRMFMRDFALGHLTGGQGNIILDDVQFSKDELDFAIEMAVESFNALTPISSFTTVNFPNKYLHLLGTARFLMLSESFHQLRNQVNVQDGDIAPTGIYEKAQAYIALAQALQQEWATISRNMKNQFNMEGAYGNIGSGYRYGGGRLM